VRRYPGFLGDARPDAFLGGVGEHLARRWRLPFIPAWVRHEARYLDTAMFVPDERNLRTYLLCVSPVSFPAEEGIGPRVSQKARILGDHRPLGGDVAVERVEGVEEVLKVVIPVAIRARPLDHLAQGRNSSARICPRGGCSSNSPSTEAGRRCTTCTSPSTTRRHPMRRACASGRCFRIPVAIRARPLDHLAQGSGPHRGPS
jgi:hypothetical protein